MKFCMGVREKLRMRANVTEWVRAPNDKDLTFENVYLYWANRQMFMHMSEVLDMPAASHGE